MKLTFFEGGVPNFGDELNKLMWDELIEPGYFDDDESTLFLGIGSILWDHLPEEPLKIVMGSGFGGYTTAPNVHKGKWDIGFLRGPRTAKALNVSPELAITDSAILTRFINLPKQDKKFKISFMPHFESIPRGNWKAVCDKAGIHYINPTNPNVKETLAELQQSELLITEAMHGAILADTLRVPWLALEPIVNVHRNKWFDWTESLNIDLVFNEAPSSSVLDAWAHKSGKKATGKRSLQIGKVLNVGSHVFIKSAGKKLLEIAQRPPQLSDESVFAEKSNQALKKLSEYCTLKADVRKQLK